MQKGKVEAAAGSMKQQQSRGKEPSLEKGEQKGRQQKSVEAVVVQRGLSSALGLWC